MAKKKKTPAAVVNKNDGQKQQQQQDDGSGSRTSPSAAMDHPSNKKKDKVDESSKNNHSRSGGDNPTTGGVNSGKRKTTITPIRMVTSLFVAIFAFMIGCITPQIWSRLQQQQRNGNTSGKYNRQLHHHKQRMLHHPDGQRYPCTNERLQEFWHENPVPGFHILCFDEESETDDFFTIRIYSEGLERKLTQHKLGKSSMSKSWSELAMYLSKQLDLKTTKHHNKQPWALFTPEGERIVDEDYYYEDDGDNADDRTSSMAQELVENIGMTLLYEGGQFLWPGVHIGFKRTAQLYSIMPIGSPNFDKTKNVTLETLSLDPLVLSVQGFLTEAECQHVQEVAAPSMEYSGVVLMDKDKGRPASDFRTSQTTFISARDDDMLLDIDYRTASLVRIPRNHQETVQVLRYGHTEKYDTHHDYFDPKLYQSDKSTLRLIDNGRKNRMATVFWYLSDVAVGGETVFPRFNGGVEKSPQDCNTGLKVKPELGKVIIFYSLKFNGEMDPNSLHGACPVKEGVKHAANKWVWNEPMRYVPS